MEKEIKEDDKSSLKHIRNVDGIYIDKTKILLQLINSNTYYFLSRPDGFGKTLLVDTFENIFKGNKDLFKGTYAYENYDFKEYPVIRLNMNMVSGVSKDALNESLQNEILIPIAKMHGLSEECQDDLGPSYQLSKIINELSRKYQESVVLVDDYDTPIFEASLHGIEWEIGSYLDSFYMTLKALDSEIKFCLLTGIKKYIPYSIFSGFNNLNDISQEAGFSSICGYTEKEFDYYFTPYLAKYFDDNEFSEEERIAFRDKIRDYYGGYRFLMDDCESLYNPYFIKEFFENGCDFNRVSMNDERLTYAIKGIEKNLSYFKGASKKSVSHGQLSLFHYSNLFSSDVRVSEVCSYLFLNGYLSTTKGRDVDYPNIMVRNAIDEMLHHIQESADLCSI